MKNPQLGKQWHHLPGGRDHKDSKTAHATGQGEHPGRGFEICPQPPKAEAAQTAHRLNSAAAQGCSRPRWQRCNYRCCFLWSHSVGTRRRKRQEAEETERAGNSLFLEFKRAPVEAEPEKASLSGQCPLHPGICPPRVNSLTHLSTSPET